MRMTLNPPTRPTTRQRADEETEMISTYYTDAPTVQLTEGQRTLDEALREAFPLERLIAIGEELAITARSARIRTYPQTGRCDRPKAAGASWSSGAIMSAPYQEKERSVLQQLAWATLNDPKAPLEDRLAAREYLEQPAKKYDWRRVPLDERRAALAALRKAADPSAPIMSWIEP
jgi:hypothetical protein